MYTTRMDQKYINDTMFQYYKESCMANSKDWRYEM